MGEPYAEMTDSEKAAWRELSGDMPWLHSAHRTLLHMTSRVKARLMMGEDVGVSALMLLSQLLSKLGATPVDETKVTHAGGEDDEDEDEHFGRPN